MGMTPEHRVRPLIPSGDPKATDPFLLLMEDWFPRGVFDRHPHRGMETVTMPERHSAPFSPFGVLLSTDSCTSVVPLYAMIQPLNGGSSQFEEKAYVDYSGEQQHRGPRLVCARIESDHTAGAVGTGAWIGSVNIHRAAE